MKEMVKRQFLFALATAALFGACTNESEPLTPVVEEESGEQVITLKVSSLGDGASTRAGRELLSEAPGQNIDIVKIIVVDGNGKVAAAGKLTNWNSTDSKESADQQGRQGQFIISGNERINDGDYTIFAYGYNNSVDGSFVVTSVDGISKDDQFGAKQDDESVIANPTFTTTSKVDEVFAGSGSINVSGKKGIGSVVLKRQVAGTFGYFKNIPYIEGASKLVLRATAYTSLNNELILGGFAGEDTYVMNGAGGQSPENGGGVEVYSINLKEWFGSEIKKAEGSNIIDATNWGQPTQYPTSNVVFQAGSVFGSTFLIPFDKVEGKNTFVLELQNDGGTVLRTWNIKLSTEDGQFKSSFSLSKWNGTSFVSSPDQDTETTYSIMRNHLYSVGAKSSTDVASEDKPIELNNTEDITITVNDNWQVIHHMVVD